MARPDLLPEVAAFLQRAHGHFIDGRAVPGDGARLAIVDPATAEPIAEVAAAGAAEIDAAVAAAQRAFAGDWGRAVPAQRAQCLLRLADLIEAHGDELAQIETLQSGKLLGLARGFEIAQAAAFLRHYAGAATRLHGETIAPSIPSFHDERYTAFTRREPVGAVAGIVPWNFSILIAVWKFASALATGCTSVIKPSEFTPLTMLRIAELALEAGIPPGALNVVCGGGDSGRLLCAHPGIAKISFTGSVATGLQVGRAAFDGRLVRTTLELGGKNPVAFLPDVPIERMLGGIMEAGFLHQGQICAAGERFFIHRSRIDETLDALAATLRTLRIGDPMDPATQFGPLANRPHLDKIAALFRQARGDGTRIVCGGETLDRPGFFVAPTALRVDRADAPLLHQETFGPIGTFLAYDDEDELPDLLNGTPYGLAASVWTQDIAKALRLVPQVRAGTVWINMHTLLDPAVPFGGAKQSGVGREFGAAFVDDYTELKSVMIRY
ncbi:aldehyde dehydrogenase family protein [Lysobacter yananisis]|uniref:Aldehyde dehydrogenase family protein n=1 Tax=Lysobacter yananisis TaxID=1003114 RepID=A0ABY9PC16_9GAMM|nr:aldehyde dehydrogenase family protein [Lysobacter yananisis]WMT04581.1 aldehyde dehydrogenase family protein [Lysobacter yananisis]